MWLIKSIGLGLLTIVAALFVLVVAMIITLMVISSRYPANEGIGWDPVSLVHQQPLVPVAFVAIILLLFATGFLKGYRRYHGQH